MRARTRPRCRSARKFMIPTGWRSSREIATATRSQLRAWRCDLRLERVDAVVTRAAPEVRIRIGVFEVVEKHPPPAARRLAIEHHAFELFFVVRPPLFVRSQLLVTLARLHLLALEPRLDPAIAAADEVPVNP